MSIGVSAINSAPDRSKFPTFLFSMTDEALLKKGQNYKERNVLDSALMCFMTVAQRNLNTSSKKAAHDGLMARYEAGDLYYYPFYDYSKAYALSKDTYDMACEATDTALMGLSANLIGNVLSVYNGSVYSEDRTNEIFDWYGKSMEYFFQSKMYRHITAPVNNIISMSWDSTEIKEKIIPILKKYNEFAIPDSVKQNLLTKERVKTYFKIADGHYGEAAQNFQVLLSEKDSLIPSEAKERIQLYFDLVGVYLLSGHQDSAMLYAHKVQTLAQHHNLYEIIPGAYRLESVLQDALGNEAARKEALLRAYVYQDSLMKFSNLGLYSEPHLKKRIADIDTQLLEALTKSRIRNLTLTFALILIGIFAIFSVALIRKNRILNNKNRELASKVDIIGKQEKIIIHNTIEKIKQNQPIPDIDNQCEETPEDKIGNPQILAKIIDIMDHNKAIFNPDFSIDELAHLCGEKTKTVSGTLNTVLSKNFNTLLNEYRVREMCRLFDDPESSSLTIEGIAKMVGYRSRTTYSTAFRKLTGLTPSEYIKAKERK